MRMHFSGAPLIPAPAAQVWEHLLDPHFVAASAPAVEAVTVTDPTHFGVVSALGVGFLKLRFSMQIELYDLREPHSASMRATGEAPGTSVAMHSDIRLEPVAADRVRLHWTATTDMDGAAAGMGRRLLEGAIRLMTERFWEDFARRAGRRGGGR